MTSDNVSSALYAIANGQSGNDISSAQFEDSGHASQQRGNKRRRTLPEAPDPYDSNATDTKDPQFIPPTPKQPTRRTTEDNRKARPPPKTPTHKAHPVGMPIGSGHAYTSPNPAYNGPPPKRHATGNGNGRGRARKDPTPVASLADQRARISITLPEPRSRGQRTWLMPEDAWHRDNKIAAVQNRISYFIYRASEATRQTACDIDENKPGANVSLRKTLIQGFRKCQFAIAAIEFTRADAADMHAAITEHIVWINENFTGKPGWAKIVEYSRGPDGAGLTVWLRDDPMREEWRETQSWYDQDQRDYDEFIRSNVTFPCSVTWGRPLSAEEGRWSHQ